MSLRESPSLGPTVGDPPHEVPMRRIGLALVLAVSLAVYLGDGQAQSDKAKNIPGSAISFFSRFRQARTSVMRSGRACASRATSKVKTSRSTSGTLRENQNDFSILLLNWFV